MKKTIDIMGVDPILFVGLNDNNIKILENHFESKIVVRGSNINLDGSKSDIEKIQLVVRNMLTLINTQGSLSMDDVNDLLLNGCSISSNNEDSTRPRVNRKSWPFPSLDLAIESRWRISAATADHLEDSRVGRVRSE